MSRTERGQLRILEHCIQRLDYQKLEAIRIASQNPGHSSFQFSLTVEEADLLQHAAQIGLGQLMLRRCLDFASGIWPGPRDRR